MIDTLAKVFILMFLICGFILYVWVIDLSHKLNDLEQRIEINRAEIKMLIEFLVKESKNDQS